MSSRLRKGRTDVRGWTLECAGESCGRARDAYSIHLIAGQVRYLEVELPDGSARLLPIGYVELNPAHIALAPGLTAADLQALPPFAGMPLERAQEMALLSEIERALDARNPFLRVDYSGREMAASSELRSPAALSYAFKSSSSPPRPR